MKVLTDNFTCLQCGACCRIEGYVYVDDKEIDLISDYLNMPKRFFTDKYTRLTHDRRSLSLNENNDGSCVFIKDNTCSIYPVRPWQCQTFPFKWNVSNMNKFCKGIA